MTHKIPDPMAMWTGPTTEAFKVWISFFPVAPFFGVEWRFASGFPDMSGVMPANQHEVDVACAPEPEDEPAAEAPVETVAEMPEDAPVEEPDNVVTFEAPAPETVETAPEMVEETFEAAAGEALPPRPANLFEAAPEQPDDLKLIKGIGPGLESKLNALGVYRFDQIASFSNDDLVWIDENLTAFKGRCFRDDWVGQARGLLD